MSSNLKPMPISSPPPYYYRTHATERSSNSPPSPTPTPCTPPSEKQLYVSYMSSHRTSLHRLCHRFVIVPDEIETLIPARRPPCTKNPWTTHIAASKEEAIKEHEQLTDTIQVYSDSSGYKGQICAAANPIPSGGGAKDHLGTDKEHTVFETEEVGLTLAATSKLIATEPRLIFPLSISIDNQASIQAGESLYTRPGSYLADRFRRMMQTTARRNDNFKLSIRRREQTEQQSAHQITPLPPPWSPPPQ
ncbi:hypothetical protein K503DRAFT_22704, partial [Rhizopogon vinicolor AM-OR11-026]